MITVEGIQAGLLFARKALHLRPSCYSLDKNGKHSGGAFCVSEQMMSIEIPLTQGYVTVVDDADSDLNHLKWSVAVDKRHGYITVHRSVCPLEKGKPKTEILARVIGERIVGRVLVKGEEIDHINGNTLDNRRGNLRIATHAQNIRNSTKPVTNTSGYKGVTKSRGRWKAQYEINGKHVNLGHFETAEEAHQAYCRAVTKAFGEFARFE